MDRMVLRLALAALLMGLDHGSVLAGQQFKSINSFIVRSPSRASKRKIIYSVAERGSTNTIVGDPTVNGATFHVELGGSGDQCFDIPASGWVAVSPGVFKFTNFGGPGGVVAALLRKDQFSGDFILNVKVSGQSTPITILPHPGNTGFATNFHISNGDEYCSGGATPAGSTDTVKKYSVKHLPAPMACGVPPACPSTTTTTTTTSVTTTT
jgi:hypothetical protein